MIDAWTQTSNHGSDHEGPENLADMKSKDEGLIRLKKNIDLNSFSSPIHNTPLSNYK